MKIMKFEIVHGGVMVGCTPIRDQAVNAAKAYAERCGGEVDVIAILDSGATRRITVRPEGSIDKVWMRENNIR